MKANFLNTECEVRFGFYGNGRIAIQLVVWDEDLQYFEPMATATINLPDVRLQERQVIVKSYSENEGMDEALIAAGITESKDLGKAASGFITAPIRNLTEAAYKEATCKH